MEFVSSFRTYYIEHLRTARSRRSIQLKRVSPRLGLLPATRPNSSMAVSWDVGASKDVFEVGNASFLWLVGACNSPGFVSVFWGMSNTKLLASLPHLYLTCNWGRVSEVLCSSSSGSSRRSWPWIESSELSFLDPAQGGERWPFSRSVHQGCRDAWTSWKILVERPSPQSHQMFDTVGAQSCMAGLSGSWLWRFSEKRGPSTRSSYQRGATLSDDMPERVFITPAASPCNWVVLLKKARDYVLRWHPQLWCSDISWCFPTDMSIPFRFFSMMISLWFHWFIGFELGYPTSK